MHRPDPARTTKVPQGNLLCRTIVLKHCAAVSIDPASVQGSAEPSDSDFTAIFSLIGAFAAEGDLQVARFTDVHHSISATKAQRNADRTVKTIAFFLPQFHVIPENDSWWGKGFTEWNNVIRAKPLFRGHYQPRLPADLGFYDLRSPTTQKAQAELAAKYGIHGFCYYYYWFNGKKLLNEPIEQMLSSKSPNFPFCVCWANENWSRNWDGQNRHVLMEQDYSLESNRALIREFITMMKDPRYIKHHGKPVLLVYRIKIIPNWLETARMWREECRKAGIGEIHLCSIRFGLEPLEGMPSEHGLDSYVLFPPQDTKFVDVRASVLDLHRDFNGSLLSYDAVVEGDIQRFESGYPWPVHRGAMLGWDNTARRLTAARAFVGCTPLRYRSWVKSILKQEEQHNKDSETLLFVNAWNEWAEGTTLEPDQRYGTSYLEATRSALAPYTVPKFSPGKTAKNLAALSKAPAAVKPAPSKSPAWFVGKKAYRADKPTVLLCAHISGHQLFGGERSFLDVLGALDRMKLNVVVTLPSSNNKSYIEEIAALSMGIHAFPYPQWVANRAIDPALTLIFSDIIGAHNVSIVYVNTIVLIEPLVAAKKMGRLAVVHARELITIDDALRERIGEPVQTIIKTVFDRTDFIIANSQATGRVFARGNRTHYVPNAVDARALDLPNEFGQRIKVGIVSSNIPKKGVADFVKVAELCADLSNVAEFVVIGPDNAQTESWKSDVANGRLPRNLKFLGYRATPKQAMSELNILLNLSSFAESFGRTVAEAMAANRPVVAYEWGALPELIRHGETGFMAPFGDTEAVAGYVRKLCRDRDMITRMGAQGAAFVREHFSHDALYQHLSSAISKIQGSIAWSRVPQAAQRKASCNEVAIVVPVYNAADEVKACLESVVKHTPPHQLQLIVINDGSTDIRIRELLHGYEGQQGIRVLHNEKNIGYTRTVNRGIREAGSCDVLLLNSDTVVTPTWLAAMRASAYAEPKIGTVTAMSDNAGAFSFPIQGQFNQKPIELTREEYAERILHATLDCEFVDVPTGSGFCMYIQRDLIEQIGLFDETLFPRGYGEENDFCMRALEGGWRNIITPWAFIYHVRTASFKGEKQKLVQAGVDVVTRKYPAYAQLTKKAFASRPIVQLREAVSGAMLVQDVMAEARA